MIAIIYNAALLMLSVGCSYIRFAAEGSRSAWGWIHAVLAVLFAGYLVGYTFDYLRSRR